MGLSTRRLRAEHSAQKFYNKRQNEPVEALAGDGAGNVDVADRLNWIYVRPRGDLDKVTTAYNKSAFDFAENDSVLIRWVKRTGLGYYEVTGYSGAVVYDIDDGDNEGTTQGGVKNHAWQHERRDLGEGGPDPLDVYARMVMPLRARPQTVPNMTLYVEAGWNPLTGKKWNGGNSPVFTAPAGPGQARYDLLYLGDDDALHVLNGATVTGASPTEPDMPAGTCPLAFVWLTTGLTSIVEDYVEDARLIVGFVSPSGGAIPDLLTDEDGAVLMDEDGAVLMDEG